MLENLLYHYAFRTMDKDCWLPGSPVLLLAIIKSLFSLTFCLAVSLRLKISGWISSLNTHTFTNTVSHPEQGKTSWNPWALLSVLSYYLLSARYPRYAQHQVCLPFGLSLSAKDCISILEVQDFDQEHWDRDHLHTSNGSIEKHSLITQGEKRK